MEISNKDGTAKVKIAPYGATVVSYIVNGEEQFFVSSKAKWDQTKAIRGGIPVIFR